MLQNNYNSDLNKQTVHLALSPWDLTDDYNRHACVTLLSFLDHCPEQAVVHLLYDQKLTIGKEKETEYTKECYQKIADRFDAKIVYHHVELPKWVCDVSALQYAWTPGTLLRLQLPELLPDLDKIIYLDCDMVVLTDIFHLWKIDLKDAYLAASPDESISQSSSRKRKKYYKKHNIFLDRYFNAGFLLLNLRKLRMDNFTEIAFSYLHDNPDLPFLDQDLLNWFSKGNILLLNKKYDVFSWWKNAMDYTDDCIIHYTIGKPWKAYYGMIDDFYWNYLIQTPWAETESDRIKYIRAAPDLNKAIDLVSNRLLSITYGTKIDKIKNQFKIILSMLQSIVYEMKKIIWSK